MRSHHFKYLRPTGSLPGQRIPMTSSYEERLWRRRLLVLTLVATLALSSLLGHLYFVREWQEAINTEEWLLQVERLCSKTSQTRDDTHIFVKPLNMHSSEWDRVPN